VRLSSRKEQSYVAVERTDTDRIVWEVYCESNSELGGGIRHRRAVDIDA